MQRGGRRVGEEGMEVGRKEGRRVDGNGVHGEGGKGRGRGGGRRRGREKEREGEEDVEGEDSGREGEGKLGDGEGEGREREGEGGRGEVSRKEFYVTYFIKMMVKLHFFSEIKVFLFLFLF